MYDLLIKNALVADGSGEKPFKADVAVSEGKIVKIDENMNAEAKETIYADGKILSPGFIDWHSHSDMTVLMGFSGANVLEQGITLEISGHCGVSVAPFSFKDMVDILFEAKEEQIESIKNAGGTFKAYLEEVNKLELPASIAFFAGHGNIRSAVMGYENREPSKEELDKMKNLVREAMENGAMGLSSGLIYPPGSYSKPQELIALAKAAAEFEGGMYTTHMRDEGNKVIESVKETIELGRKADIPVVVSHHKVVGRQNEGKSTETLRLINEAKERGQKVYLDQYPYDGGGTSLMSAVPPKYASEGPAALIEKLKDPKIRAEIKEALLNPSDEFQNLIYDSGIDKVYVGFEGAHEFNGMTLKEIGERLHKDPIEAMFDLMIEEKGNISGIYRMISQWDLENIMKYPYTMAGIDGSQADKREKNDHPRVWATFPKIIGHYCRDRGFFTLEECIHRFTGLAAKTAGFHNKGLIKENMDADLVIFDFDKIAGKADYGCADIPNEGIDYVFVNGVKAVENGKTTGLKGGRILLRNGIEYKYSK